MNKGSILLAAALFCTAWTAQALELMLRNGTVLNNVTILNITQNGVNIVADQGGQGEDIISRQVLYSDLTTDSMNSLLAYLNSMAAQMENTSNPMSGGMQGNSGGMAASGEMMQPMAAVNTLTPMDAPSFVPMFRGPIPAYASQPGAIVLAGYPHNIQLTSITMLTGGTLGWASAAFSPGTEQSYGKMYVYGVMVPQGGVWLGNVYPTSKKIWHLGCFYPCYATSPQMADKIDASVPY